MKLESRMIDQRKFVILYEVFDYSNFSKKSPDNFYTNSYGVYMSREEAETVKERLILEGKGLGYQLSRRYQDCLWKGDEERYVSIKCFGVDEGNIKESCGGAFFCGNVKLNTIDEIFPLKSNLLTYMKKENLLAK